MSLILRCPHFRGSTVVFQLSVVIISHSAIDRLGCDVSYKIVYVLLLFQYGIAVLFFQQSVVIISYCVLKSVLNTEVSSFQRMSFKRGSTVFFQQSVVIISYCVLKSVLNTEVSSFQRMSFKRGSTVFFQLSVVIISYSADEGQLYVFGWNKSGQLGCPVCDGFAIPRLLLGLPAITKVSCGWNHTLAISDRGTVFAWGSNVFGQLGIPAVQRQSDRPLELPQQVLTRTVEPLFCGHLGDLVKCPV